MAVAVTEMTQLTLFDGGNLDAAVKNERALMELPFFSLVKTKCMQTIFYTDGAQKIEIKPGADGLATIWDQDVILYISSIINAKVDRGETVSPRVRFKAHDLLKFCERSTSSRGYSLLWKALDRLQGTQIRTNIASGGMTFGQQFSWISDWKQISQTNAKGKVQLSEVEITLCDWLFYALVKERRVLTLPRDYFKLTGGIERRLCNLARKHCGRQAMWRIKLPKLAEKCGQRDRLAKFRERVEAIASVPGYRIRVEKSVTPGGSVRNGSVMVVFINNCPDEIEVEVKAVEGEESPKGAENGQKMIAA